MLILCIAGFNGTITVANFEDISSSLSIRINSVSIDLSAFSITCEQTSLSFSGYTYSIASTPILISTSPSFATPGDSIELTIIGISESSDDNTLIFGGRTPLPCVSVYPMALSATNIAPVTTNAAAFPNYNDSVSTLQCTLSVDIAPGKFRTLLHVSGRGWASAHLEDTSLEIRPRITTSPTILSSSLRGGDVLVFSTVGLLPSSITMASVSVGNTPCPVQSISLSGELTCKTQPAVDDGYSSLITRDSPLAYWTLQNDYHRSNGLFLESEGEGTFRSGGTLGYQADATVVGEVEGQHEGISGNSITDQAAFFEASYLVVSGLRNFSNPTGFSAEFWLRTESIDEKYRILFKSSTFQDGISQGYIVLLNPCNKVEFWVATGISLETAAMGGFSDCDVITNTFDCSQLCRGVMVVEESSNQYSLPSGVWHILRDNLTDWSNWRHVYFSWEVDDDSVDLDLLRSSWSDADCSQENLCNGTQALAVHGVFTTSSTVYLRSINTDIEMGGVSILPVDTTTAMEGGLSPFVGFLDEIVIYRQPLSIAQVEDRLLYGNGEHQPVWVTVEGVDGIGTGSVPDIEYPEWNVDFTNEIFVDWDNVLDGSQVLDNATALRFQWTG